MKRKPRGSPLRRVRVRSPVLPCAHCGGKIARLHFDGKKWGPALCADCKRVLPMIEVTP
jgi:hypothetical protein